MGEERRGRSAERKREGRGKEGWGRRGGGEELGEESWGRRGVGGGKGKQGREKSRGNSHFLSLFLFLTEAQGEIPIV